MSGTRRCKHGEALDSSLGLSKAAAAAMLVATTAGGRETVVYNMLTSVQQFLNCQHTVLLSEQTRSCYSTLGR